MKKRRELLSKIGLIEGAFGLNNLKDAQEYHNGLIENGLCLIVFEDKEHKNFHLATPEEVFSTFNGPSEYDISFVETDEQWDALGLPPQPPAPPDVKVTDDVLGIWLETKNLKAEQIIGAYYTKHRMTEGHLTYNYKVWGEFTKALESGELVIRDWAI